MNKIALFLGFLYRQMLLFYPTSFREEYSAEMKTVFSLQLENTQGDFNILCVGLREIRDLPLSLLRAYTYKKREGLVMIEKHFTFRPGSWQEVLLACMPLLLMGFVPALFALLPVTGANNILAGILLISFLAVVLIGLGIIGLLAKLPRWAAGYTIIPLTILIFGGLALLNYFNILSIPREWGFAVFFLIFQGIFLLLLALAVVFLLQITRKIKAFSGFAKKVQNDPSTLSFMLYGAALVIVLSQYEDVAQGSPYLFLSILALGLGVWGYLGLQKTKTRTAALVSGSSLACLFALIANLFLFRNGQNPEISQEILFRVVFSLLVNWLTIQILILAPLFLHLNKNRSFSGQTNAV